MDILDDVLKTLDMRGALYFRTNFSGSWGTTVPDYEQAARFHLVVQGTCHVTFPTGEHVTLRPGDLILIPNGVSHVLSDSGLAKAPPLETTLKDAGYDGRGVLRVGEGDPAAATQMICGHFTFRKGGDHPLISTLPKFIHVTGAGRAREPWLDDTLKLVSQRMFSPTPGATATVTRLSEIVFIELLKSSLVDTDEAQSVIQALKDPQIGAALSAIHENPASKWSVDSLAQHVGMSRSRFSDRFSDLLGVGPMRYLADWRLQKALVLLDEERASVQKIARESGYQSVAAFSRAFSHKFGMSPRSFRRQLAH
ncbi:MAG: AraC family transcriptional regulator [Henriciella sp.]